MVDNIIYELRVVCRSGDEEKYPFTVYTQSRYLFSTFADAEAAVQRFSDVMWIMQQIVFMSMDKRLAIFLHDEITENGTDVVIMTHEQIARHLGTAREVVTRMLKHFAADGWIEVTRKGIRILDKKKLRDVAI